MGQILPVVSLLYSSQTLLPKRCRPILPKARPRCSIFPYLPLKSVMKIRHKASIEPCIAATIDAGVGVIVRITWVRRKNHFWGKRMCPEIAQYRRKRVTSLRSHPRSFPRAIMHFPLLHTLCILSVMFYINRPEIILARPYSLPRTSQENVTRHKAVQGHRKKSRCVLTWRRPVRYKVRTYVKFDAAVPTGATPNTQPSEPTLAVMSRCSVFLLPTQS